MALSRISNSSSRLKIVVALSLTLLSLAQGFPLNDRELDSAVEGVQKYLESSGFPKMTRGEVLDFLNDFSRNSRVSRSDNGKKDTATVAAPPDRTKSTSTVLHMHKEETKSSMSRPKIPNGESPLSYGYPMSLSKKTEQSPITTTPTIFVTVPDGSKSTDDRKPDALQAAVVKNGQKKTIGPSVDLNAYAKFKKIPEGKHLKIDDEMKDFLNDFGLLDDAPKSGKAIKEPQRRNDDAAVTETIDEKLLESVLVETGNGDVNVTQLQPLLENASTRDHIFSPSDVKTVDVNKIAKIVENIRLLADDNNTISLSQDVIQKKLENITAAIAAIDQPSPSSSPADNKGGFNGYEVFFDDDSKEVDSDLPETPTASSGTEPLNKAHNAPDPLSTDELQQLLEKNKNDVKRQEPETSTTTTTTTTTSSEDPLAVSTSSEAVTSSAVTTDSSSEAASAEVTSSSAGVAARDSSTAAAVTDANPSLSQLAESFGGGETASDPPPSVDETATRSDRPKNGLYFYVDWNSFLTVNEGQKNQVNLRFAPKAGNAAHFLKVNVP